MGSYKIILRVAGGFGNQLFQLSALENFINRFPNDSDISVLVDTDSLNTYEVVRAFAAKSYYDLFFQIKDIKYQYNSSILNKIRYGKLNCRYLPHVIPVANFSDLMTVKIEPKTYVIDGYFQHELNKFSVTFRARLREQMFEVKNEIKLRDRELGILIESRYTLLHVRREDYLTAKNKKIYNNLKPGYYEDALCFSPTQNEIVLTGDDAEFCTSLAKRLGAVNLRQKTKESIEDFIFIMHANFIILSNSTFCWKAFEISETCEGGVVPKRWFLDGTYEFHHFDGLIEVDC